MKKGRIIFISVLSSFLLGCSSSLITSTPTGTEIYTKYSVNGKSINTKKRTPSYLSNANTGPFYRVKWADNSFSGWENTGSTWGTADIHFTNDEAVAIEQNTATRVASEIVKSEEEEKEEQKIVDLEIEEAEKKRLLNIIGVYPGISTIKQVEKISIRDGIFRIGGYDLACVIEYDKEGKVESFAFAFSDEVDVAEGLNKRDPQSFVFLTLRMGFQKKFGQEHIYDKRYHNGVETTYFGWTDEEGNQLLLTRSWGGKMGMVQLTSGKLQEKKDQEKKHEKERLKEIENKRNF